MMTTTGTHAMWKWWLPSRASATTTARTATGATGTRAGQDRSGRAGAEPAALGAALVTEAWRRGRSVNWAARSAAVRAWRARPVRSSSSSVVRRPAW
jgi:hypothetical protein